MSPLYKSNHHRSITEQYPIEFTTVERLKNVINTRFEKRSKGDERQYISISGIAPGDFYKMETGRLGFGNSGFFSMYFEDAEKEYRGNRSARKSPSKPWKTDRMQVIPLDADRLE
jgi:hypothetical protein